jgi:hypothetical protein
MNQRPWPVVMLLVLAVAGCGASPTADTEQRGGELEEVKADRDRLAALVKQLAATSATLEAYTINNRQGCLDRLRALRQRVDNARAALQAGKIDGKEAASHLGVANKGLDRALGGDCAPAAP